MRRSEHRNGNLSSPSTNNNELKYRVVRALAMRTCTTTWQMRVYIGRACRTLLALLAPTAFIGGMVHGVVDQYV